MDRRFMDCPAEACHWKNGSSLRAGTDVVCFWSTYLSAIEDTRAARHILNRFPDMKLIFMGTAATWKPESLNCQRTALCFWARWSTPLEPVEAIQQGKSLSNMPGLGHFNNALTWPFRRLLDVTAFRCRIGLLGSTEQTDSTI